MAKKFIIKHCRLQREHSVTVQNHLQTTVFNWNGHRCAAHWITGERKALHDFPDFPVPEDQFQKPKHKYVIVKNV